ncbi:MAG: hypothetical protein RL571_145 [Pseudomonadota bacterium]
MLLDQAARADAMNQALMQLSNISITIEGLQFEQAFTASQVNFPQDGKTAKQLLKHADVALYEGKALSPWHIRRFESHMAT